MADITSEVLDKLRTFDTPTVCNLIELFDIRPRTAGYMRGSPQPWYPEMGPVVGFATTLTLRASAAAGRPETAASLAEQVARFEDVSGPPVVVIQDLDNPPCAATFGEIMCRTYQAFGAVGLISNGAGRDFAQIRAIGFPVFANQKMGARGYFHFLQVNVPIHVGGIAVLPDDLLHGDCNGVTTIPGDIAADVADIGDEAMAAEQLIFEELEAGANLERFKKARAEARALMETLRKRVRRSRWV